MMNALDERINKIRQQNEEIRRRYEEVEEDKKKAAKSNALVQMVPSSDWPQRKEPPEFSNLPRNEHKPKPSTKEHVEHSQQHGGSGDGKKVHVFAHGEGPPPDPKYNFLADSEREEYVTDSPRESGTGKGRGRPTHGNLKKRGMGREGLHKDNRMHYTGHKDRYQPEYDAWKAERNRIDEDRISRQRTAEGNWRREWDNDKVHIIDEGSKRERPTLGNFVKKEHKDYDKRYFNGNEHANHRGNNYRSHQGGKNYHGNHDFRYNNSHDQHAQAVSPKAPVSPGAEERTVTVTDKSIKVTLNQGAASKGPVMSVKVNSPSIAGTGRVGPRQRTRVTYSSHSDAEAATHTSASFSRQKSFEDKFKGLNSSNTQKSMSMRRSHQTPHQNPPHQNPQMQKKKESNVKSPYAQRKDYKREDNIQKQYDIQKPKVSKTNEKMESEENSGVTQALNQTNEKNLSSECSASVEHEQMENLSKDEKMISTENISIVEKFDEDQFLATSEKNETVIESVELMTETVKETSEAVSTVPENTENEELSVSRNDEHVHENIVYENIDNVTKDADSLNEDLNQLSAVEEKTVIESTSNERSIEEVNESNESIEETVKEVDNFTETNDSANKNVDKVPMENVSLGNEIIARNTQSDEMENDKTENSSKSTDNLIEIEEKLNNDQSGEKEIPESSTRDNCDKLQKVAVDDNQDNGDNDLKENEKVSSDSLLENNDEKNSLAAKEFPVIDVDNEVHPDSNVPTEDNTSCTESKSGDTDCKEHTNVEKLPVSINQGSVTNNQDKTVDVESVSATSDAESIDNVQTKDKENLPCKERDKVTKNCEENIKLEENSST